MPHIKVNNLNLYYETHGQGKPLVLIGGYAATTLAWIPIVEKLSRHFQCIVFDNRGAGFSDVPPGHYSVEDMAEDTMALIHALNLKKPHLYGNSLGGTIVQTAAYKYPTEIDRIIIGNSTAKFSAPFLFAAKTFLDLYEQNDNLLEQAKLWFPWVFSSQFIENDENVKMYFENSLSNLKPMKLTGLKAQLEPIKIFDSRGWLNKINRTCLILNGDEDLICLPQGAHYLHQHIKNAQIHTFKQCGHLPHIEYPEENNKVVLDFLNS